MFNCEMFFCKMCILLLNRHCSINSSAFLRETATNIFQSFNLYLQICHKYRFVVRLCQYVDDGSEHAGNEYIFIYLKKGKVKIQNDWWQTVISDDDDADDDDDDDDYVDDAHNAHYYDDYDYDDDDTEHETEICKWHFKFTTRRIFSKHWINKLISCPQDRI